MAISIELISQCLTVQGVDVFQETVNVLLVTLCVEVGEGCELIFFVQVAFANAQQALQKECQCTCAVCADVAVEEYGLVVLQAVEDKLQVLLVEVLPVLNAALIVILVVDAYVGNIVTYGRLVNVQRFIA